MNPSSRRARALGLVAALGLSASLFAQKPGGSLTPDEARRLDLFVGALTDPQTRDAATLMIRQLGPRSAAHMIGVIERERAEENVGLARQLEAILATHSPGALAKHRMGLGLDETLILYCDYSENRVVGIDGEGNVRFALDEIFGAWDAELTPAGHVLITEFSVSRVREVDPRNGDTVWECEGLKNPYDADRLPNGNTLIANTFGGTVIEVDHDGQIVWEYEDVRAFDVERLPNGNTLIADSIGDRVLEVDAEGNTVSERKVEGGIHDVDRLADGRTAVTLRRSNCVTLLGPGNAEVMVVGGLSSPSDADRLPDGEWIVAENSKLRRFDAEGRELWSHPVTWAVEVNVY